MQTFNWSEILELSLFKYLFTGCVEYLDYIVRAPNIADLVLRCPANRVYTLICDLCSILAE